MLVNHILDHMLDYMLDQMIIGFVTTELYLQTFRKALGRY